MRSKALLILVLAIFSNCVLGQQKLGQRGVVTIYLLEGDSGGKWCGHRSESEWKSEVESIGALVVGSLEYSGDRVSGIQVTEQGESGDWIVYDEYSVDSSGRLQKLNRIINILPGSVSERLVFSIGNGKAVQQSRVVLDLDTKTPVQRSSHWVPDVPIVASLQEFPFASLLRMHQKILSEGKVCIDTRVR